MQERPYQTEAIQNVMADLSSMQYKSLGLVMPTGAGKTFTLARILQQVLQRFEKLRGATIVVVVHRDELLEQTIEEFQDAGLPVSRWNAVKKDISGQVIVAMVASSKTLSDELNKHGRTVVLEVVDEGHHYAADSYQRLSYRLGAPRTLLVTATPIRADGLDLGIQKISFDISFLQLVKLGFLAPPEYHLIRIRGDQRLGTAGGDYRKEDLARLNNNERNTLIAEDYKKNRDKYGKTLTFCVDVDHCIALRGAYQAAMPELKTAIVTGETPRNERRRLVEQYNEGHIDVLFNVNVFTEGTNMPSIHTIQIARPTKSAGLWAQMVGRGARTYPGKDKFIIADYAGTENNYAWLADGFAQDLLGAAPDEELAAIQATEEMIQNANDWLNSDDVGMKKKLKSMTEVLEIAGVLMMRTRRGDQRRLLVRKKHVKHLQTFIEYVFKNPPPRGANMMAYLEAYTRRYDPSLFRWPGEHQLNTIGWCLYNQIVVNKGEGKPLVIFRPIPDLHEHKPDSVTGS